MTNLFALLVLGFVLGIRHATDPDHVIAVTTIVARSKTAVGATAIGAAWGVGHTLTILIVGGGIILFGWVIPPRLGLSMEFSVGLMLIALGVASLTVEARRIMLAESVGDGGHRHEHPHAHGDYVHTHVHAHDPEAHPHEVEQTPLGWMDRRLGGIRAYRHLRPLIVGVVHGLAGSAAIALLVLATIRKPGWALAYLVVFGAGTIVGMMLMTAVIVLPFIRANRRSVALTSGLRIASGVISVTFGLFVAYRIGIVDGLFSAHAHWTPQ
jgi:ABC-type nickel/cobalt efflux system permease component RcnA